ncbi:hypothetical protein LCGC14_0696730, partial [marine sediment metagenome]
GSNGDLLNPALVANDVKEKGVGDSGVGI